MVRALRVLALLVLVVTPLCVPRASAEDNRSYKLLAVRFKGLHEFKSDEVLAATGLRVGGMVAAGEFQSAADKLVATGAFASVAYDFTSERAGYTVDFTLEEAQKYLNVDFENFVWASDDELIKYVSERVPLFHGRTTESGAMIQGHSRRAQPLARRTQCQGSGRLPPEQPVSTSPSPGSLSTWKASRFLFARSISRTLPTSRDKEKSKLIGQLVNSNYERMSANIDHRARH
jgi:outer membrane protein assembly factor BamA